MDLNWTENDLEELCHSIERHASDLSGGEVTALYYDTKRELYRAHWRGADGHGFAEVAFKLDTGSETPAVANGELLPVPSGGAVFIAGYDRNGRFMSIDDQPE